MSGVGRNGFHILLLCDGKNLLSDTRRISTASIPATAALPKKVE